MGLTEGSYEAYCLDQATWYLGSMLSQELEQAGQKRAKGEAANEAARKRVLAKYLGDSGVEKQFADPAAMFSK